MNDERFPQDDENTKYVPSSWEAETDLAELLGLAAKFWPKAGLGQITVSHEEIQFRCFGYDLYDSSDYRWYWVFRKVN